MTPNRWLKTNRHIILSLCTLLTSQLLVLSVQAQLPDPSQGAVNNISATESPGQAVLANMSNQRNPLVQINTNVGDIWIELFPQAAPDNVEHFMALLGDDEWRQRLYESTSFHRVERNLFIQAGELKEDREVLDALPTVSDEINARGLGLEQLPALQPDGQPHPWLNISDGDDFRRRVLSPLYEQMGIDNRETLSTQQGEVLNRLTTLNLLQAHELMGYEYNPRLPSRRPLAGSVVMVNRGPNSNQSEFAILLADMPWLTGTHTVIGQIVGGSTPATLISQRSPGDIRITTVQLTSTGQASRASNALNQP